MLADEPGAITLFGPNIDGDYAVWDSNLSGNFDVYAYSFSADETFQVTTEPGDQLLSNVYGDLLAYADFSNRSDVHVAHLTLTQDPPCFNLGGDADGDVPRR